jgi:hypothetical protein
VGDGGPFEVCNASKADAGMRRGAMNRVMGTKGLCGVMLGLLLSGHAVRAEEPRKEDPVLVGRFVGVDEGGREVSVDFARESLVIVDAVEVLVTRLGGWTRRQRGTETILAGVWVPLARVNRLHGDRHDRLVGRIDVLPGEPLTMCMATKQVILRAKKSPRPDDAGAVLDLRGTKGVNCFKLMPLGVPSPAPGPEDPECMRECRQQNMMRAVSAEQIDEDCRKTCRLK